MSLEQSGAGGDLQLFQLLVAVGIGEKDPTLLTLLDVTA